MPTPRAHGGAAATLIPFVKPAFKGLNTQIASGLLGVEWATILEDTVFDDVGRLSSRPGYTIETLEELSEDIVQLFTYERDNGNDFVISSTAYNLYVGTGNIQDATGTLTPTAGNWQFVNFRDSCVGVQQGHTPIIYSGGTEFVEIEKKVGTTTELPKGNAALSAFGRLWIVDEDLQTIRYSNLLDETDWEPGSSRAGLIDMTAVWPHGTDTVVALAEHNGRLLVFGEKQIVIWDDPQGTALGMDVDSIQVVDTYNEVGCIARDSVQTVNGDLWWLSNGGIVSLARLIQERSAPSVPVSANVRDFLLSFTDVDSLPTVRSVVSLRDRYYLISFPTYGKTFWRLDSGT